jgi:hypothetical protein
MSSKRSLFPIIPMLLELLVGATVLEEGAALDDDAAFVREILGEQVLLELLPLPMPLPSHLIIIMLLRALVGSTIIEVEDALGKGAAVGRVQCAFTCATCIPQHAVVRIRIEHNPS